MRRLHCTLLFLYLIAATLCAGTACAAIQYPSYTYSPYGKAVAAPQAYEPSAVITGALLGVGPLKEPGDVFVSSDGRIYLLDTGNSRLICLDSDWRVIKIITEFDNNGTRDRLSQPSSVYVDSLGQIYIADTRNARIVVLDQSGALLRTMSVKAGQTEGAFRDDFVFQPVKVAASPVGTVYATDRNVYDGLIEFGPDGQFRGFMGAPRVVVSPWELFWRRIATREQLSATSLLLPTQYNSLDTDSRGMILTTEKNTIRRLNPSGEDVLVKNGLFDPTGDIGVIASTKNANDPLKDTLQTYARTTGSVSDAVKIGAEGLKSNFVDIASRPLGMYSVLDGTLGRIFTYDSNGNLLYVFGGLGNSVGTFVEPVAIDSLHEQIIVVDRRLNQLTIFSPTEYADLIHRALLLYSVGRYDESEAVWRQVLERNVNFTMAYRGIGKNLLRQGEIREAMRMFKLGADRKGYSDAFAVYRQEMITRYFGVGASLVLLVVLLVYLGKRFLHRKAPAATGAAGETGTRETTPNAVRRFYEAEAGGSVSSGQSKQRRRLRDELAYALTLVFHPFDGFWELKHSGKGSVLSATAIMALVSATYLFMRQYTGFVFNYRDLSALNIYYELSTVLFPFLLWCIVNWALTTFTDGKGTFRDIYVYSAYALVPIILVIIPATVLSNLIRIEEGGVYYLLLGFAVFWSLALLLIGTLVTHDYSFGKTLMTSALIVAGMVAVLLLGMVFVMVMGFLGGFIADVYSEIAIRI